MEEEKRNERKMWREILSTILSIAVFVIFLIGNTNQYLDSGVLGISVIAGFLSFFVWNELIKFIF